MSRCVESFYQLVVVVGLAAVFVLGTATSLHAFFRCADGTTAMRGMGCRLNGLHDRFTPPGGDCCTQVFLEAQKPAASGSPTGQAPPSPMVRLPLRVASLGHAPELARLPAQKVERPPDRPAPTENIVLRN